MIPHFSASVVATDHNHFAVVALEKWRDIDAMIQMPPEARTTVTVYGSKLERKERFREITVWLVATSSLSMVL